MVNVVAVILGGVVIYITHWFWSIPVPPGFKNPWFLRLLFSTMKLIRSIDWFREFYINRKDVLLGLRRLRIPPKPVELPVKIKDMNVSGVRVRLYTPEDAPTASNPGIIYFHGGGWVLGDLATSDGHCKHMAHEVGAVVMSVEYRLAPEHPYPVPLNDCVAAATYFLQHTDEFGVDKSRIAISGDSAGGNLAAATALRLRDTKIQPQPKLQVLGFPALQAIDINSPSFQAGTNDPLLSKRTMAHFWLLYATGESTYLDQITQNCHTTSEVKRNLVSGRLNHSTIIRDYSGRGYKEQNTYLGNATVWNHLKGVFTDPYFAPLMSDDVSGLPEAIIVTSEQDVLRDDGIWYAKYLKDAGVKVTHHHFSSGFHVINTLPFKKEDFTEARKLVNQLIKSKL